MHFTPLPFHEPTASPPSSYLLPPPLFPELIGRHAEAPECAAVYPRTESEGWLDACLIPGGICDTSSLIHISAINVNTQREHPSVNLPPRHINTVGAQLGMAHYRLISLCAERSVLVLNYWLLILTSRSFHLCGIDFSMRSWSILEQLSFHTCTT